MKTPRNVKLARLGDAVTFAPFDAAEYLDSEEMIAAYLNEAAASGDDQLFLAALADIARARSMTKLAKDSGLGRESLYKSLRAGAKPRFDTIASLMRAMGLQLSVVPTGASPARARAASKTPGGSQRARPSRGKTPVRRALPPAPRAKADV